MSNPHWLYIPDLFEKDKYTSLLEELKPYLTQGKVSLFGETFDERRLTAYFTTTNTKMYYSGRWLEPLMPPTTSIIELLFTHVNSQSFVSDIKVRYNIILPVFNAVFVNWYRPPNDTDKPDGLGPHSDDEGYLASSIILSITYCEKYGARMFRFHEKTGKSTKIVQQYELEDGSALFMLGECQKLYKHSVSDRKLDSKKRPITGGRINLTFRSVKI